MGSVKPGGVCAEARGCSGGGDGGRCAVKTLGKALHTAAVVVVELNQACRVAGLLRDNSSNLQQHANST